MDKSIITRELQILLEAINEQFEIIREYEDFIPQIEFDMIMENVRKLYETFHRLQRLNDPLLFVEKKISGPQDIKNSMNAHHSLKPLIIAGKQDEDQLVVNEKPPAEPLPEILAEPEMDTPMVHLAETPVRDDETEPSVEAKPEIPETTEPVSGPKIPIRPLADKEPRQKRPARTAELDLFASEEPVFNIKLKEAREKSLGPKVSRHESFKAAIGINDKFMFINELFDGNLREYNECIETLGGFKTLPQAQEYLDLLRRRNNWHSASNAFKRIKELVENRF